MVLFCSCLTVFITLKKFWYIAYPMLERYWYFIFLVLYFQPALFVALMSDSSLKVLLYACFLCMIAGYLSST
jgi:hypothetical protein